MYLLFPFIFFAEVFKGGGISLLPTSHQYRMKYKKCHMIIYMSIHLVVWNVKLNWCFFLMRNITCLSRGERVIRYANINIKPYLLWPCTEFTVKVQGYSISLCDDIVLSMFLSPLFNANLVHINSPERMNHYSESLSCQRLPLMNILCHISIYGFI